MKNYRKRKKDKAKEEYLESICDEIMKFEEQNIRLNVMMMDLSWKEGNGIQNNGTEHSKGNTIADKRQVLRVLVTYITQFYGQ